MGFKPAFAIIETKMNLPDEVMDYPTIVTIAAACGDLMAIANDLYSYNVELVSFFVLVNISFLTSERQASAR